MHARAYRPEHGRFLTQDRYASGSQDLLMQADALTQNRYAFGGGNPVNNIEFDGHEPNTSYDVDSKQIIKGIRPASKYKGIKKPTPAWKRTPNSIPPPHAPDPHDGPDSFYQRGPGGADEHLEPVVPFGPTGEPTVAFVAPANDYKYCDPEKCEEGFNMLLELYLLRGLPRADRGSSAPSATSSATATTRCRVGPRTTCSAWPVTSASSGASVTGAMSCAPRV